MSNRSFSAHLGAFTICWPDRAAPMSYAHAINHRRFPSPWKRPDGRKPQLKPLDRRTSGSAGLTDATSNTGARIDGWPDRPALVATRATIPRKMHRITLFFPQVFYAARDWTTPLPRWLVRLRTPGPLTLQCRTTGSLPVASTQLLVAELAPAISGELHTLLGLRSRDEHECRANQLHRHRPVAVDLSIHTDSVSTDR